MPLSIQFTLGRLVGLSFHHVARRRRHIAEVNVALCFPDLDERARRTLVRETFAATGVGLFETAYAWLRPVDGLLPRVDYVGFEHVQAAIAEGRGVLMLGAHFSVLDLAGAFLGARGDFDAIYRGHKNPVMEWVTVRGRGRHFARVVERRDVRGILRLLRQHRTVWYAADQDYGRRHSVFAPFFGVDAATITVTSRLARATGAAVVFGSAFRDPATRRWTLRFTRLADFPSGDDREDAARINRVIEGEVRRHPEQYFWIHRRFKTQADAADYPYADRAGRHVS